MRSCCCSWAALWSAYSLALPTRPVKVTVPSKSRALPSTAKRVFEPLFSPTHAISCRSIRRNPENEIANFRGFKRQKPAISIPASPLKIDSRSMASAVLHGQLCYPFLSFIRLYISCKCPSLRRQADLRTLLQSTMLSFIS
jgi:hypothetical protein